MTTVREHMHPGLIMCRREARLADVAAMLRVHRIHAVVVSDDEGRPIGVVSDTDLLAGEWLGTSAENRAVLQRMTAGELMSQPLASIEASRSAVEAAREIRARHVARLLVTDGSAPVGVISISDLLGALPRHPPARKLVRDVMSWGYVACRAEAPMHAAVRAMIERNSRSLLVLDDTGHLVGVVTGLDLLGVLTSENAPDGEVGGLMHAPVTVLADAPLQAAVDLMLDREIHRLVVVDGAAQPAPPLGLISTTDVMVEMAAPESGWR